MIPALHVVVLLVYNDIINVACSFFILDDSNREREETMSISLLTYDPSILVSNRSTIIRIQDKEDGMEFNEHNVITEKYLANLKLLNVINLLTNVYLYVCAGIKVKQAYTTRFTTNFLNF